MTRDDCKFLVCPYAAEGDPRCKDKCQQPKQPGWWHRLKKKIGIETEEIVDATGEAIGEAHFDQ